MSTTGPMPGITALIAGPSSSPPATAAAAFHRPSYNFIHAELFSGAYGNGVNLMVAVQVISADVSRTGP